MSGHSKWHNIQKTKGAQDAKRAQAFTKIAREMIVAVKEGGSGDPANNSRLAAVIAKAKATNMPNDNIKRTIEKALGSGATDNYERVTYEGYGPSGVAIIVDAMTDNRNRTASDVRHYFDKYGGNMGAAGCVSWSFDKKGVIVIDNEDEDLDEEAVFESALEAGADDLEAEEGIFTVYTQPDDVAAVAEALSAKYRLLSAQVEMVPQNYITLTDEEDVPNAIGKLRAIYPNLMKLDYDNTRTRGAVQLEEAAPVEELSPLDLFAQFYRQQNNQPMTQAQTDFVRDLIETIWEEDAP